MQDVDFHLLLIYIVTDIKQVLANRLGH